ncbi:MAG: carboxypeptidase-like regulatory domain-containing protein [Candidatus Bathyarchaeia archaeon]
MGLTTRAAKTLLALLLLLTILLPIGAQNAHASPVTVSPGKWDLNLGADFPTFSAVKLSYPNSSILTNSTGDLLFTVTPNASMIACYRLEIGNCFLGQNRTTSISIYIPPDFSGVSTSQLWTSFSNNYDHNSISVSRQSSSDQIAPNWWRVLIQKLIISNETAYPTSVANRIFAVGQPQYIRLFQVTSPVTAGRYFFKAFYNLGQGGQLSIGSGNFPTLVVKASKDPAYISGVLRNSGYHHPSQAGFPITLPSGTGAQVLATGYDYLGRPVSAQTFINSAALGRYTLFGVAPGTYNITVYAAGFVPAINGATEVSVAAAQSLEGMDIYLTESVNVTGIVLSKTADGGLIPWGNLTSSNGQCKLGGVLIITGFNGSYSNCLPRAISIKLLNLDGSVVVASTPYPYGVNFTTTPSATSFDFSIQHYVGWDGRIPQDYANYFSGLSWGDYLLQAFVTSYVQLDEVYVHVANETTRTVSVIPLIRTGFFNVTVHFKDYNSSLVDDPVPAGYGGTLTVSAYDQQGILRAQNVTAVRPGTNKTAVELGGISNSRSFGEFSLFSQNYGLLPGTYHIQATFTSSPSYAGYANVGIRNLYYQLWDVEATIGFPIFKEALVDGKPVLVDGKPVEIVAPVAIGFPIFKGGGILLTLRSIDDQLPPLDYLWAYPGANIQILILDPYGNVYNSNATQLNNATLITPRPLCGNYGKNYSLGSNSACVNGTFTLFYSGLLSNDYEVVIRTLGYTQSEILHLHVVLGGNADASVWMILNPVIDLTVAFKDEGLLSVIDSTQPYAQPINNLDATPARAEVFDDQGNFVAASQTYIRNNSTIVHFVLAGMGGVFAYSGDPRFIWSGFYDTTDGVSQNAGGLFLYPYRSFLSSSSSEARTFTVRLWVDGYYQFEQWHVNVPGRDENWNGTRLGPAVISMVESLNRASRISGTVVGPDFFDEARPLSWATITLQPADYTLSGIIDVQPGNYTTSSLDGYFQVWVPEGNYGMGVSLNGYSSYSAQIPVPSGSDLNMYLWLDNYQASPQAISGPLLIARKT